MIRRETRTVTLGVRALARRCGCSATFVSYILSGKRKIDTPMGRKVWRLSKKTN